MSTSTTGEWTTKQTVGRGLEAAPALRSGLPVTLVLAAVGALGRVAVPVLVQQTIDRGIGRGRVDLGTVVTLAGCAAVVVALAATCQRAAVRRLGARSEEALLGLRRRLFGHIHRLSLADLDAERRGALVARCTSDVEALSQFFSWGALAWLLDGAVMVLVAVVMLAYNWVLALVAFAAAAPLALLLHRFQRRLARAYDRAREDNAMVMTAVGEFVTGSDSLRVVGALDDYARRTKATGHGRTASFVRAGSVAAFMYSSAELFSMITVVAVVLTGLSIGPSGRLTAGALVGFVFLTYRFLEPVAELTEWVEQTQTAVAGLRRVLAVLDMPAGPPEPTRPKPLPAGPLAIDLQHVTFAYPSRGERAEEPALVDVSVRIEAGCQVAVVGATGSGKTTLGRVIARLVDPDAGVVRIGGVGLTHVANEDLRRALVVVAQEPFLFRGSIADNLGFARPGVSREQILEVVAALDLRDWLEGLPDGLDTEVGARGSRLSSGERQLVALIRASLADPRVLLLDEATSSVDSVTEALLSRALERVAQGPTTVAIAHRLSTAVRADRVLLMEGGRLVADGTHTELVAGDERYRRLYESWVASNVAGPTGRPSRVE